jgi:hypothetical protein
MACSSPFSCRWLTKCTGRKCSSSIECFEWFGGSGHPRLATLLAVAGVKWCLERVTFCVWYCKTDRRAEAFLG